MQHRIRPSITDGSAGVRLNRAAKMNVLDPAMFEAIAEAGAAQRRSKLARHGALRRRPCFLRRYGHGESVAAMAQEAASCRPR
jgi:hypothetical protein